MNYNVTILSIISSLFFLQSLFSQIDTEEHIKTQAHTGLILGAYANNTHLEMGVGHILIDKPCNRSHHRDFGPQCSFPKKLELDATFEYSFLRQGLYGQKLTVLYTLLAWQDNKNFGYKSLYYSIGHLLFGFSAINYTDFNSNKIFFRPEISWMAPQRIHLHGKHSISDQLQLNLRLIYGYNIGDRTIGYQIPEHQFGIQMMFLYTNRQ